MKRILSGAAFLLLMQSLLAQSFHIDLNQSPLYVRTGFTIAETTESPRADDPRWVRFPPAGPAGRALRLKDLPLPEVPRRRPFSLRSTQTMEFSYYFPFILSESQANLLKDGLVPGLHLGALGDNYQIFLNGMLIYEALDLDPDGEIQTHFERRYIFFPINPGFFQAGLNHLSIRILGDPALEPLGLFSAGPHYIADYRSIERRTSEIWPMTFIGLYLFIGVYHLFIYFSQRQDRNNLFYGLFSADLAIYLFTRTHYIYNIFSNRRLILLIELCSLYLIIPFVGAFLDYLRLGKITIVTKAFTVFSLVLIFLTIVTPSYFGWDFLSIWQVSSLIMAVYYLLYCVIIRFFMENFRRWKREKKTALVTAYLKGLLLDTQGNLLFGSIILLFTAVFDILDSIFFNMDLVLTQYGFFVFTMSTALILANRFNYLHSRMNGLNQSLEERIRDLKATSQLLSINEKKYRSLFNGTSDPVALLTEDLVFLEGNRAAKSLFSLDRPGDKQLRLTDLLFGQDFEREKTRIALERAVRKLKEEDSDVQDIGIRIRTPIGEAKNCRLRLEFVTELHRKEILLRVVPEIKDPLLDGFKEGREVYEIPSNLNAADEASRRITRSLNRYLPEDESSFLMICLREIIINAVEHGNLEISFEDKSRALQEERYFEFVQERQQQDPFCQRTVHIEYSITANRAIFRVSDMGPGFDHQSFMKGINNPENAILEHGRGLFMTHSAFDTVRYNDKGNQITLIKNFTN